MKKLLLLRHAKSSWKNPTLSDFDRPLNERGRDAARDMGRHIAMEGLVPELVLCSTAARAEETWTIAEASLSGTGVALAAPEVKHFRSLYLAPPARILETIRRQAPEVGSIMVIAHNPGLENLTARLAGPGSDRRALARVQEKYPTAALALFTYESSTWSELEDGAARLTGFVQPRDLKAGQEVKTG